MPSRPLLIGLLSSVLAVNLLCGLHLSHLVTQQSVVKEDYAEANSIRNGLLSVDVWKSHIRSIASERISRFQFSSEQQEAARVAIEKALNALITGMDKTMRKPQKTLKGKMRKLAFKVFVDTQSVAQDSPEYAEAVLKEVRKPANLEKMKTLALDQIKAAQEGDEENGAESPQKQLFEKYGVKNIDEFNAKAGSIIQDSHEEVLKYTSVMVLSLFLVGAIWWWARRERELYKLLYGFSLGLAFILLLSALALPMIDIDARIRNVDFLLMGQHLQFTNQLLFFRSKSIMQMVSILITAKKLDTIFVGLLILLFSIVFPITKLTATGLYVFGAERWKKSKVAHFFVFDSGKWSMADVFVVAIFMAYIGFNGVLNSQLKNLNFQTQAVGVIATNETSLKPGFVLFMAYVLFSLALSTILKKIDHRLDAD